MTKTFKRCAIFCITAVWLVLMRIVFGEVNLSDNISSWLFSFFVQVIGLGLCPILLCKFWVKDDIRESFRFNAKIHPLIYPIAVVLGITVHFLIISFSIIWQNIIILIGFTPTNNVGTIYSGPEVFVFGVITSAIMPGICEEITYRGLGTMMFEGKNDNYKIVMTALLFGLGHQFILQTGYAFVAGLVLGFLMVKTRSIFPGMIVHFLNNFISELSGFSEQTGGGFHRLEEAIEKICFANIGTIILMLVVSAAATFGLLLLVKKLSGKQPETEEKEGSYYYPSDSAQYIDEIFGKPIRSSKKVYRDRSVAWYEYAFLYAAIAIMIITTLFTFVWGAGR